MARGHPIVRPPARGRGAVTRALPPHESASGSGRRRILGTPERALVQPSGFGLALGDDRGVRDRACDDRARGRDRGQPTGGFARDRRAAGARGHHLCRRWAGRLGASTEQPDGAAAHGRRSGVVRLGPVGRGRSVPGRGGPTLRSGAVCGHGAPAPGFSVGPTGAPKRARAGRPRVSARPAPLCAHGAAWRLPPRRARGLGPGVDDPAVADVARWVQTAAFVGLLAAATVLVSRPSGRILVGERDGEIVAAVPIAGGSAIADPGRSTSAMISLLGLRAAQWRDLEDRSKSRERVRVERQPLRRAA